MNKKLSFVLVFAVILFGIIASMYMMSREKKSNVAKNEQEYVTENTEVSEKITDECTDEYESMQLQDTTEAVAEEVKVSPNAVITFEKYYKECEHTTSRYEEISKELVNLTKAELQEKYDDWTITFFTADKIIMTQECEGQCGEHYMLRDVEGKINIYKLDENGNEKLQEETDISTEYLTETDMIDMNNGLIVYGKENLNKLLEDFE